MKNRSVAVGSGRVTWRPDEQKASLWIVTALVLGIVGAAVSSPPAHAQSAEEVVTEPELSVDLSDIEVIVIAPRSEGKRFLRDRPVNGLKRQDVRFHVFEGKSLEKVLKKPTRGAVYKTLDEALAAANGVPELIFISDDSVLPLLTDAELGKIRDLAVPDMNDVTVGTVVGLQGGDLNLLRGMFNLGNPGDASEVQQQENPAPAVFAASRYGQTVDGGIAPVTLELGVSTSGDSPVTMQELLEDVRDWIAEFPQMITSPIASKESQGAWDADFSDRWVGNFSGDGGQWEFQLTVSKLDTTSTTSDWYRIDTKVQSAITSYRKNDNRCGWYTDRMTVKVNLTNAALWEHMPSGTVNTVSQGFSIGGSLDSQAKLGLSASYSQSYGGPEVQVVDKTLPVDNLMNTIININGPDYKWWPFYPQPASVGRSTFGQSPSLIAKVAKGQPVKFRLTNDIRLRDDKLIYKFPATIRIIPTEDTKTFDRTFTVR